MFYKMTFLTIFSGLLIFTGCNSSDDAVAVAPAPTASEAVTTISGKLISVANLLGGDSAASAFLETKSVSTLATGASADWTTSPGVSPLSNSGNSSLKLWMTQQFDETFQNSNGANITFAGRIKNALDIFCYMANTGLTMDSATNLPTIGTHSIVLTEAANTTCGGGAADSVGATIGLTVTATTDTTYFDRLLSFALPGTESCPMKFYARLSGTAINMADSEDQSCDTRNHASKSAVFHDVATKVTRFHYFSKAFEYPSGFETYRGYLNETTDEAYIVGFYGSDQDGSTTFQNGVSFTVVGKPASGGSVAISAKSIGNTIDDAEYQACVNPADMTIATDNSLACELTGTDAALTHVSVIQDLYDDFATRESVYNIGETETVNFTDSSDIFN